MWRNRFQKPGKHKRVAFDVPMPCVENFKKDITHIEVLGDDELVVDWLNEVDEVSSEWPL